MIVTTRTGGYEVRMPEWGSSAIPPHGWDVMTDAGVAVTRDSASGLPAVTAAILLLAETFASLDALVFDESQTPRKRVRPWQYDLLNNPCGDDASPFDFWFDIEASIEACGNAFAQKIKSRGRVVELVVLDSDRMMVEREGGRKAYRYHDGQQQRRVNPADVLHFRGPTLGSGVSGLSPISMFRGRLGTFLQTDRFEGRYFQNDARPGVVLKSLANLTRDQARQQVDNWNQAYAGTGNAHRTAVLGGGMDVQLLPISLQDAQFVESRQSSVFEVARMFRLPASLLEAYYGGSVPDPQNEVTRFLKFGFGSRLSRIQKALRHDPDLFGSGPLLPVFDIDALTRMDGLARAQIQHYQIQNGSLLVDEARAEEGRDALPDGVGKIPQITPVGGGANPEPLPIPPAE